MGKGARVRAARKLAELATTGQHKSVTKSVERRIRKEDAERRRQRQT